MARLGGRAAHLPLEGYGRHAGYAAHRLHLQGREGARPRHRVLRDDGLALRDRAARPEPHEPRVLRRLRRRFRDGRVHGAQARGPYRARLADDPHHHPEERERARRRAPRRGLGRDDRAGVGGERRREPPLQRRQACGRGIVHGHRRGAPPRGVLLDRRGARDPQGLLPGKEGAARGRGRGSFLPWKR